MIIFVINRSDRDYEIVVKGNAFEKVNEVNIQEVLKSEEFILDTSSSKDYKKIFCKIERDTIPLAEALRFSRGIKTSDDSRFILKSPKKQNAQYKKVYRGKNIKAYSINWGGEYIWYRPDLMKEKVGCLPHSEDFFEVSEKLVTQRVNSSMQLLVAYDDEQRYFLDTVNVSNYKTWNKSFPLKYICAVLNSRVINFYYCNKYRMPTIGGYELHSIPLKVGGREQQRNVIYIVDRILTITKDDDYLENAAKQAKVREYEKQIDQLVYKLYDLTPEEIKIVEGENDK